jgi:general secretion pathway protein E
LVDMGVEPFLLASSLLGVLAQRLVRKVCPACCKPHEPDAAERAAFNGSPVPEEIQTAVGCAVCNWTGYQGRTGIYELLNIDDEVRRLVHDVAAEAQLRQYATARGMFTLRSDGLRWVREGVTTFEEVLRVTRG